MNGFIHIIYFELLSFARHGIGFRNTVVNCTDLSFMNEKYRVLYDHLIWEPDLIWRAIKRAREGYPEEVTMN